MSEEKYDGEGFFGKNSRKNKGMSFFAWVVLVAPIPLIVLTSMKCALLRGTRSQLAECQKELESARAEYESVSYSHSNACEKVLALSEEVKGLKESLGKANADVKHWKRETEKMHGSVVVVERRESALKGKYETLASEYEDVKKDNDELNKYLLAMKQSTKDKLVEIDKKYIELQLEMRKYKRNYETLRDCLMRNLETKHAGKQQPESVKEQSKSGEGLGDQR